MVTIGSWGGQVGCWKDIYPELLKRSMGRSLHKSHIKRAEKENQGTGP